MIYSGVDQNERARCGVAILIDKKWTPKIESYSYINERIVTTRLKFDRGHLTVIGVYAPEEGKKEETENLYKLLQKILSKLNKTDHIVIAGDLNARIGRMPIPHVVGTNGEQHLNNNGYELRHFATENNLKITNTFFKHKDIHKYTWSARGSRSIIDYIMVNEKLRNQVEDTRVYRGSDIYSDHYLVVATIRILGRWKKIHKVETHRQEEVFKVYLLQEESIRDLYQRRLNQYLERQSTKQDINEEWDSLRTCIEKAAYETLAKKKKIRSKKGLRQWNQQVKEAIDKKKQTYQKYLQTKSEESKEIYKEARNEAKRISRKAHQESWEKFISQVENDLHGRQTFAYKAIKQMNKTEKDTAHLEVIDEQKWIQHYEKLWYNPNSPVEEDLEEHTPYGIDYITMEELMNAIKTSKNRKATGADQINMELLKYGGLLLHLRILHLINQCWLESKIPATWQTAQIISLFKKGDRNNCENYRGISLLNAIYKIYSRVINNRLKSITEAIIGEEQHGFRKGRSTNDNVFIIKQIIEKRREFNLETHIAFIDFEKAFDRVDRNKLFEIMEKRGYPKHLIRAVKSMYTNTNITIKMQSHESKPIKTNQGLKQGCSMSPTLFNIYIDNTVREWDQTIETGIKLNQHTKIKTILFADDLLIIQSSENDLQRAIYKLYLVCKKYNMKISTKKTKVMAFEGDYPIRTKIVIDDHPLEQVSHFNYLGCYTSFEKDKDIDHKIHKFQYICGTIHRTLKNKTRKDTMLKFYKTMATPTLLYGCESWVITQRDNSRIQASEMRFLRKVQGISRLDRHRNEDVREKLNIYSINDKIKEYRTKWKQHINRMDEDRLTKQVLHYKPRGRRSVGRPKKRWSEV